jgi:hypothetical protein
LEFVVFFIKENKEIFNARIALYTKHLEVVFRVDHSSDKEIVYLFKNAYALLC